MIHEAKLDNFWYRAMPYTPCLVHYALYAALT